MLQSPIPKERMARRDGTGRDDEVKGTFSFPFILDVKGRDMRSS